MTDGGVRLPFAFTEQVVLSCRATVGGENVEVRISMVRAAYDDPGVREVVENQLRQALMQKILGKWTPKIHVVR